MPVLALYALLYSVHIETLDDMMIDYAIHTAQQNKKIQAC